jgi:Phasin protein
LQCIIFNLSLYLINFKEKFMFSIPQQFSATAKSYLEAQIGILQTLTNSAFFGMEKVIAINLRTAKISLEASSNAARQLLSAADPQKLLSSSVATLSQPKIDSTVAPDQNLVNASSSVAPAIVATIPEPITTTSADIIPIVQPIQKDLVFEKSDASLVEANPPVLETTTPAFFEPTEIVKAIDEALHVEPATEPARAQSAAEVTNDHADAEPVIAHFVVEAVIAQPPIEQAAAKPDFVEKTSTTLTVKAGKSSNQARTPKKNYGKN